MPTYEFKTKNGPTYEIRSEVPMDEAKLKDFGHKMAELMGNQPDIPTEPPSSFGQRTKEVGQEVGQAYKNLAPAGRVLGALPGLITPSPTAFKERLETIKKNLPHVADPLKAGQVGPVPMYMPGGPAWGIQSSIPQDVGVATGAFKRGSPAEQWTGILAPILEGLGYGGVKSLLRGKKVAPGASGAPTPHPTLEPAPGLGDKPKYSIQPLPEGVAGPIEPKPRNYAAMKEMLRSDPDRPIAPGKPTYAEVFGAEVPTDRPAVLSWAQRLWAPMKAAKAKISDLLPQDYNLHVENPQGTKVMPIVDRSGDLFTAHMEGLLKHIKDFTMNSADEWIAAEEKASKLWRTIPGAENPMASIPESVLALMPKGMAAVRRVLLQQEHAESEAAAFLGERILRREPGYVVPHIADKDYSNIVKIGDFSTGLGADLRSTLGAFEKPRLFATIAEGMAKGVKYIDPRLASLYRIYAGQKLIHTARLVEDLWKEGVLFKTASDAIKKGGKAYAIEGIPGSQKWYTASESEAKFIRDSFRATPGGLINVPGLGQAVHYTNKLFRNWQLLNPFPHTVKNVGYKLGLSGVNMTRVPGYWRDYTGSLSPMSPVRLAKNPNALNLAKPETALFNHIFPLDAKDVLTTGEILRRIRYGITGNKLAAIAERMEPTFSRNLVFNVGDRFMKYARFREYLRQGVNPYDAAAQSQIDLIRYSMRSRLLDIWKAIPMNYFATWRYGTVQSLYKNLKENPVQALVWIAGWDLFREALYRGTGIWFHSPIDYIEAPAVSVIEKLQDAGATGGASAITALMIGTVGLGPGGQFAKVLEDVITGVRQGELPPSILDDLKKGMWGMLNVIGTVGDIYGLAQSINNADPQAWLHLLTSAILGAHTALNYRPRRALEALPESVMPKSRRVQAAEEIQDRRAIIRQHQREGRGTRPRPTIEELTKEE